MSAEIQFDSEIQWDGNHLSVWAVNNGARIMCRIPHATIHEVPPFSDVLTLRGAGHHPAELAISISLRAAFSWSE
jgi:hypothetical protein